MLRYELNINGGEADPLSAWTHINTRPADVSDDNKALEPVLLKAPLFIYIDLLHTPFRRLLAGMLDA